MTTQDKHSTTAHGMTITCTADTIAFPCASCGAPCRLTRRTKGVLISGTFCPDCDEQYYTRWDGVLHRGKIAEKEQAE